MMATTSIKLDKKEKSFLDVLWNLYVLQNINVKKAFQLKIKNEMLSNTYDEATEYADSDITNTAHYVEAMKDVEEGRITDYDSLKDFYNEMGV